MWIVQNVNGIFYGPFTDMEKIAWTKKINKGPWTPWNYIFHHLCEPKPCIPAGAVEKLEKIREERRESFAAQQIRHLTKINRELRETNAKLKKAIDKW